MCLEPFGATGLFILGRGVLLLLVGVVREKEEEEEKRKGEGWKTGKNRPRAAQRPHISSKEPALPHFIIRSLRRNRARPEAKRKDI